MLNAFLNSFITIFSKNEHLKVKYPSKLLIVSIYDTPQSILHLTWDSKSPRKILHEKLILREGWTVSAKFCHLLTFEHNSEEKIRGCGNVFEMSPKCDFRDGKGFMGPVLPVIRR